MLSLHSNLTGACGHSIGAMRIFRRTTKCGATMAKRRQRGNIAPNVRPLTIIYVSAFKKIKKKLRFSLIRIERRLTWSRMGGCGDGFHLRHVGTITHLCVGGGLAGTHAGLNSVFK